MKVVVALGGNALLRRDQPPTAAKQLENIRIAAAQRARGAVHHDVVLTHGNGPQVGQLALHAAAPDMGAASEIEPDLAEWDYGDFEGRRSVDIRQDHPGWDIRAPPSERMAPPGPTKLSFIQPKEPP